MSRRHHYLAAPLSGLLMLGIASRASAQQAAGKQVPPPAATTQESGAHGAGENHALPELNFDGVAIDDVVAFLQDVDPSFKAVLVRDPNVPQGYPPIAMRLKRVTLAQFLNVLTVAYPDVQVQEVASPDGDADGAVHVIRVSRPKDGIAAANVEADPGVRIYNLGNALTTVLSLKGNAPDDPKNRPAQATSRALDDILSLVKASLATERAAANPVLEVHPETMTLIFKGTTPQRLAVEGALRALGTTIPMEDSRIAQLDSLATSLQKQLDASIEKASQQAQQNHADVARLEAQLAEERNATMQAVTEAERLKVRLETIKAEDEERLKAAELRLKYGPNHPAVQGGNSSDNGSNKKPTE